MNYSENYEKFICEEIRHNAQNHSHDKKRGGVFLVIGRQIEAVARYQNEANADESLPNHAWRVFKPFDFNIFHVNQIEQKVVDYHVNYRKSP